MIFLLGDNCVKSGNECEGYISTGSKTAGAARPAATWDDELDRELAAQFGFELQPGKEKTTKGSSVEDAVCRSHLGGEEAVTTTACPENEGRRDCR